MTNPFPSRQRSASARRIAFLGSAAAAALSLGGTAVHAQVAIDGGSTVTVPGSQASPYAVGDVLQVGRTGIGTLAIGAGGIVTDTGSSVGVNAGSNGSVTVTGAGAQWNSGGALTIGDSGTGALAIAAGGSVSDTSATIAFTPGTFGTVTVSGTGSTWLNTDLSVGRGGNGSLTISNGGSVTSTTSLQLGTIASGRGSVTVSGTGSTLAAGFTIIRTTGSGALTITNGGSVTGSTASIGRLISGNGNVLVSGTASSWTTSGEMRLGESSNGLLTILSGGQVTNGDVYLGYEIEGRGAADISGAGSVWTNRNLFVALNGQGGLSIHDGGTVVTTGDAYVSYLPGSTGGATVTGAGSIWRVGAALHISGQSPALVELSDGAVISVAGGLGTIFAAETPGQTAVLSIGGNFGDPARAPGFVDAATVSLGAAEGVLRFNHDSNGYDFAPVIAGAGRVRQAAGFTRLTADSRAFTGFTDVEGGTLAVDGAIGGTVAVMSGARLQGIGSVGATSIADDAVLVGRQGATLTLDSLALASGAHIEATLGAPGAQPLFDVTGGLTLDGTLDIADDGGFGPGVYALMTYGGALTDNGLAIGAVPAGANGSALGVQTSVAGQVNLVNQAAAAATLQFWDGATAGAAANGRIDGGSGAWSVSAPRWTDASGGANGAMAPQPGFAIFQAAAGTVTVDNAAGTVAATGMQFASDGYVIDGGALSLAGSVAPIRVGDGSAAGARMQAVIKAVLTGAAGIDKSDLGTLVLSGANTYSGGTTISAGTLVGDAVSLRGSIVDRGALVFDQAIDGSFAGTLSGTGTLRKQGAARLTFTGDGSGLTGATLVAAGLLSVNGSLARSIVTIGSGATLGGTGTVGGVVVQSGGSVAPGNSIGTLNVAGNLTFQAGSTYIVEVDATTRSADRIAVTGAATLAGTVSIAGGSAALALGDSYSILTATQGISGTFGGLSGAASSPLPFLTQTLSYTANSVALLVDINRPALAAAGITANQRATGAAVAALPSSSAIIGRLAVASNTQAIAAFDSLSGEIHAAIPAQLTEDARLVDEAMAARTRKDGPGGAWGQVFANWGHADGDGNFAAARRTTTGFAVGADLLSASGIRLGAAFGYTDADLRVAARNSHADVKSVHFGAYGAVPFGPVTARGSVAYGRGTIDTDRAVTFGAGSAAAASAYHGSTLRASAEIGYRLGKALTFEPVVGLTLLRLHRDGFGENAGLAALSAAARTTDIQYSTVAIRASTQGIGSVSAQATIGWRHGFGDTSPTATMAFAGGTAFTVAGTRIARDTAAVDANLGLRVTPRLTVSGAYSGRIAGKVADHAVKGGLALSF